MKMFVKLYLLAALVMFGVGVASGLYLSLGDGPLPVLDI